MSFGVTTYSNGAVGILNANLNSLKQTFLPGGQDTLGINSFRYESFEEPCRTIDNATLTSYNDPINSKKGEIQTLGNIGVFDSHSQYYLTANAAESAITTIFNDTLSHKEALNNIIINLDNSSTVSDGDTVSEIGGSATGVVKVSRSLPIGIGVSFFVSVTGGTFGIGNTIVVSSGLSTVIQGKEFVGYGLIYDDITVTSYYPYLEPADPSQDSPFEDQENKIITPSNAGQGVGNTFYKNSLQSSTLGDYVDISDTLPFVGDVFAFDTASNPTGLTSITSIISEIDTLRTGISSYVGAGSTVKSFKKGYAINVWSLKKNTSNVNSSIVNIENAIRILEDPSFQ